MLRASQLRRCAALHRRLFAPFNQGVVGYDVAKYDLATTLPAVTAPPPPPATSSAKATAASFFEDNGTGFTCDWQGQCGHSTKIIEDYFIAVLAGFDITAMGDGVMQLKHSRKFVGWAATDATIDVHYTIAIEPTTTSDGERVVRKVVFAAALSDALVGAGCEEPVARCVDSPEAMRMLVALRRARVKPGVVSHRALLSASKKQESWASALGVL
jgi:hypothetical protein